MSDQAEQLTLFSHSVTDKCVGALDEGILVPEPSSTLTKIDQLDSRLAEQFSAKLLVDPLLTRQLVSFQANKVRPIYRWYKYKEAFSASLVDHLLGRYRVASGKLLDPFAGMGTALFAARTAGLEADGIEVLPIGQEIITARLLLENEFVAEDLAALQRWSMECPWEDSGARHDLTILRITDGAYPAATADSIERYMGAWSSENHRVQAALRLALLCVLESISYTRKDGQYLRWDHRSGRRQRMKPFNKGPILKFNEAIRAKIDEIALDLGTGGDHLGLFPAERSHGIVRLFPGSCLEVLPTLHDDSYDGLLTSPPYCNRYDYTRTYALELALLGVGEPEMIDLRQHMLSCTVENREKDLIKMRPQWSEAIHTADHQQLLQAILVHLEEQKAQGRLNNNGIPRMVRGYFYEMACVIAECARVLKPGAPLLMVNDNVRYAGASVSVDMILSDMAEALGFSVESVLVLPNGKGNSSQQMGQHGRDVLRKCVYVWRAH